ncbi:MAG: hypothetical protein WCP45_15885 [Verrucomicrobiota bacterium]
MRLRSKLFLFRPLDFLSISILACCGAARLGRPPSAPEDKIVSRYTRSLDLLLDAVRHTNRAYVFDNSRDDSDHLWVAEITGGSDLEIKCDPMPAWFQRAVWNKIQAPAYPPAHG